MCVERLDEINQIRVEFSFKAGIVRCDSNIFVLMNLTCIYIRSGCEIICFIIKYWEVFAVGFSWATFLS